MAVAKKNQGQANPRPKPGSGHGTIKHTAAKPKPKSSHPAKQSKAKPKRKIPKRIDGFKTIPIDKRKPGQLRGSQSVVIQAWTFALQVRVLLGANGAQISAGYGTYTEITRPRDVALLSWQGRTPYQMTIDVVFNGQPTHQPRKRSQPHAQGTTIEQDIEDLETLATRGAGMISPPQVRLFGAVPHADLEWVITDIAWGDAMRRPSDGARIYQLATITLHEWVGDPYLKAQRPKGKADGVKFRWYAIKSSDSVKTIAKALLGNPSTWPQIVAINPGMNGYKLPQPHYKVGDRIRVPASPAPAGDKNPKAKAKAKS